MIINGNLELSFSDIESLGNLEEVKGNFGIINCRKLQTLNKLKTVKKLIASECINLESLGNLEWVNFHVKLDERKKLKSLGKLKYGSIYINLSGCENLKDLGELKIVTGVINLKGCKNLKHLGDLTEVKGTLFLYNSGITKEYIILNKPQLLKKCDWELY